MKILITGGAGFIGSHIAQQLIDQNHEVVIFDDFSTTDESLMDSRLRGNGRVKVVKGNVKDTELLIKSLEGVDAVIHMAAVIAVEESVKDPVKYMDNNVMGTTSVLMAMREAGVKKIVISSSATVYGEPKSLPILEDAPLSAANPYAASKIAMEALCESFNKTDGFDIIVLRYFNPYGPGENHIPETHAIPNFILSGLAKKPLPLFWKGEQVRDFIFVEDLASAHIAVLSQSGYEVFNVGSESGVKIIDVINALSDILGFQMEIEDLGERPGDVMGNYASSAKLKEATGWEAKVDLKDGLTKTVEWFKNRG